MKEIPLTQGMVALVDDEDYEEVMKRRWHAHKKRNIWYAETSVWDPATQGWNDIGMHALLLGAPTNGMSPDHIDGNGLNNQRGNLRWATRSQQRANSATDKTSLSGFKGVYLDVRRGRWCARIKVDARVYYLGSYPTPQDAARAYDARARQVFGEFARPNFPT